MKRNGTPKAAMALEPFSLSHYGGHYFSNALPCESCGAAANRRYAAGDSRRLPLDEYDLTLQEEAYRLAYHAKATISKGEHDAAAGMLRDAARLLDLLGQRQRAKQQAEDAAKSKHRKAARS
jgi:hypothetical protein